MLGVTVNRLLFTFFPVKLVFTFNRIVLFQVLSTEQCFFKKSVISSKYIVRFSQKSLTSSIYNKNDELVEMSLVVKI